MKGKREKSYESRYKFSVILAPLEFSGDAESGKNVGYGVGFASLFEQVQSMKAAPVEPVWIVSPQRRLLVRIRCFERVFRRPQLRPQVGKLRSQTTQVVDGRQLCL